MKITGIVLILLGLIAGAVVVTQMAQPGPAAEIPGPVLDRPNMTIPLAVCGAAIVIGGLLVMFGGRGYYVSNNPRVRN